MVNENVKVTKQQYYDLLVKTSEAGGFPSVYIHPVDHVMTGCAYLARDGKKCVVGLLMPDGHPAQQSGHYFRTLLERTPDLANIIPEGMKADDLHDLQTIHDSMKHGWNHEEFLQRIQPIFA